MIDAPISPCGVRIVVVAVHRRTDGHANAERETSNGDGRTGADPGTRYRGRRVCSYVTTTVAGAGVLEMVTGLYCGT
jgi:hypothetical protein